MSLGYGGYANLVQHDNTLVMYCYSCYNINNDGYKKFKESPDGELYIGRNAFVEPEIREKIKKMPSGKKKMITKRIKKDVPFGELFDMGKIKVKNAGGTWETNVSGVDIIALKILLRIFDEYQETGEIPQKVGLFY